MNKGRGLLMPGTVAQKAKILVCHPQENTGVNLSSTLEEAGFFVTRLSGDDNLKNQLGHEFYNLILLCDNCAGGEGNGLLRYIKQRYPSTLVIIFSEQGNLEEAISFMRQGAYDYFLAPLESSKLIQLVQRSLDRQQMGMRHKELTRSLEERVIHLQQLNQRMAALYKIIRDTRGLGTMEDSIHKVLEYLGEAIDLHSCFCILFDEEFQRVIMEIHIGHQESLNRRLTKILKEPGAALRRAFIDKRDTDEVSRELERELQRHGIPAEAARNFIICPLFILKNMFGYLCLVNPDRPAYTFADRQMLSIVASQAVTICEENHTLMQTSQLITMGNLTSELAHDLKTPLANVRGILQTLDGKWDHENTRTEAIDMIMEEIDRANSLALDLLSFSKNQELDINYCNIHDLLSKALMITRNTLNKAGVQVIQNFCKDSLMVWANENELIDSFVNIIVNAVQAMPEGGTLTISTRNNLHQSAGSRMPTAPVRFAEIEITDTGIGMTRKEMDRIFERFYTTKEAGTGLGLAIVSRVVKRYQGFIDVKSEKDKGSTFIINLPQR